MIFVTGGTGLLGSHLLVELTKADVPVRAIYRSEKKRNQVHALFNYYLAEKAEDQFARIEWIKGDLFDIPFLQSVMEGCSSVYHCAGLVSFHPKDFNQVIKVNRVGTANIVNVALERNIQKLCHVSSTAAIGGFDGELIDEKTAWKNTPTTSGYSISKYSAEKEVWRAIEEGLNAVIVNPCVILGAGNWNDSSLTIFRTLKKGSPFYPPGSNATVDARDVAEIMIQLMESDIHSERYLCIGSNQSLRDLICEISSQLNVSSPRIEARRSWVNIVQQTASFFALFRSRRPSITEETVHSLFGNKRYDNSKVRSALNFTFRDLKETTRNAIAGRID